MNKTSKLTTLGLTALLTACSGKTEYVGNSANYYNQTTVIGVPLSTSIAYGQGSGSLSILLLEKGNPVLMQTHCSDPKSCSNAEALVKSKAPGSEKTGEISVKGNYENNILNMSSIIVDNYKITF